MNHRWLLLVGAGVGMLAGGCASTPRGLFVSLAGSDCCTARFVDATADQPATVRCRCLATAPGSHRVAHDDCTCHADCVCWSLAATTVAEPPWKRALALLSR